MSLLLTYASTFLHRSSASFWKRSGYVNLVFFLVHQAKLSVLLSYNAQNEHLHWLEYKAFAFTASSMFRKVRYISPSSSSSIEFFIPSYLYAVHLPMAFHSPKFISHHYTNYILNFVLIFNVKLFVNHVNIFILTESKIFLQFNSCVIQSIALILSDFKKIAYFIALFLI